MLTTNKTHSGIHARILEIAAEKKYFTNKNHSGSDQQRQALSFRQPLGVKLNEECRWVEVAGKLVWNTLIISPFQSHCGHFMLIDWTYFIHGRQYASFIDTLSQKRYTRLLIIITSANVDRFSKFFHCQIPKKTLCVTIARPSTSLELCCYTTWWNLKMIIAADFNGVLHARPQNLSC